MQDTPVRFLRQQDPVEKGQATPVFSGFPDGSYAKESTWVWSLDWEDSLEEGIATHSSVLACRIPMDRGAWQAI